MATPAQIAVNKSARSLVASVAKSLAQEYRAHLESLKEGAQRMDEPDWLWRSLLLSLSTMGNSRGAKLVKDKQLYDRVTFDAFAQLSDGERSTVLKEVLYAATVRMPDKKAAWLCKNFIIVKEMGGPLAAKKVLLKQDGREEKMKWLKQFWGIGEKYSRNIMMDVYHPDFRESLAVDQRIKAISKTLGLSFKNYDEHEQFYLDAAHEAGLEGWELDRLIYRNKKKFIERLGVEAAQK